MILHKCVLAKSGLFFSPYSLQLLSIPAVSGLYIIFINLIYFIFVCEKKFT